MLLNFVVAGAGTVKSASHPYVAGRLRPLILSGLLATLIEAEDDCVPLLPS
jgi:hypothetical protein